MVLRRLCLDFGPHLQEPFPMGRFHWYGHNPIRESWTMEDQDRQCGFTAFHPFLLLVTYSCLPLGSQLLGEENWNFPSGQKHCRLYSIYYLPWALSFTWRSITSFGSSNSWHPWDWNCPDCPTCPEEGHSFRAQSLVHLWKRREPSGRLITEWLCSHANHGICLCSTPN